MAYVGITIEVPEALRLLNLGPEFAKHYYDTEPINQYLKESDSALRFVYVDKGVCILGLPLRGEPQYWPPMLGLETSILRIKSLAQKFRDETNRLCIDLSKVEIAVMESEPIEMENPEPFLILCNA
jgi:hypothetical protein